MSSITKAILACLLAALILTGGCAGSTDYSSSTDSAYITGSGGKAAASLRDQAEALPAALEEAAAPGPLCSLRWDTEALSKADGSTVQLPSGAACYLLEAFSDGSNHLLQTEQGVYLAPAAAVDVSGCQVEYQFAADQDMRTMTGFSGEELEKCLSGGLAGLGQTFAQAEAEYGVNALFMIAICQHESGNGESGLATSQNNLIGLRRGGGWASFDSYADCVAYLGGYLATYYLSPGCPFYHGSTIAGVSVTYCGGSGQWISHIINYMSKDLARIQEE